MDMDTLYGLACSFDIPEYMTNAIHVGTIITMMAWTMLLVLSAAVMTTKCVVFGLKVFVVKKQSCSGFAFFVAIF